MAIKPPAWCSHAVPEMRKGWVDPATGELLASSRFTQAQIDEWNGTASVDEAIHDDIQNGKIEAGIAAMEAAQEAVEEVETDMPVDDLEGMTKMELEALGREHGVELDRRKNKRSLVSQMRNLLSK